MPGRSEIGAGRAYAPISERRAISATGHSATPPNALQTASRPAETADFTPNSEIVDLVTP